MERRDNQPGQTPEGEQKSTAFQHSLETTMANTASALAVMHIKQILRDGGTVEFVGTGVKLTKDHLVE